MKLEQAAKSMESLGNETRLAVFRLLVRAGEQGVAVGKLQARLGIPASTLSHHLSSLVKVGLVSQERHSRRLICRAQYGHMDELLAFLSKNCCAGLKHES